MSKDVVVLTGVAETLDALKKFDKKAVKEFNRVVNDNLAEAKADALRIVPTFAPLSNWKSNALPNEKAESARGANRFPGWNPALVSEGIKATKAEGKARRGDGYFTSAAALKNTSPAGAVFEIVGRKKRSSTGRGSSFIPNLEAKWGKASRVVWRAVDRIKPKFEREISQALEVAKKELQKNLDANK